MIIIAVFGALLIWISFQPTLTPLKSQVTAPTTPAVQMVGDESRANAFTSFEQSDPNIDMNEAGVSVVVWQSRQGESSYPGVGGNIFAVRYDQTGREIVPPEELRDKGGVKGNEFRVNTPGNNLPGSPSVTMNAAGSFVVAWYSRNNGKVFARRFDPSGAMVGEELEINSQSKAKFQDDARIAVGMDDEEDFVVAWFGTGPNDEEGIYARWYDSSGAPRGDEALINTTLVGEQSSPSVAMNASGSTVFTWFGNGVGDEQGVFARQFDQNSVALGEERLVNENPERPQKRPSIDMINTGEFVIVWQTLFDDDRKWDISFRTFSPVGTPGPEIRANSKREKDQEHPAVALSEEGEILIAWDTNDVLLPSRRDVFARLFDPEGNPLTQGISRVNSTADNAQWYPGVAMNSQRDIVILWSGYREDDVSGYDHEAVVFQRFKKYDGNVE